MRKFLLILLTFSSYITFGQTYCTPTYTTNGCALGRGIKAVKINGIDLTTNSPCGPNYYTDFTTSTPTVTLSRTQPNTFTVEYYSNASAQGLQIWIDYDLDGVFRENESIYKTYSNLPSPVTNSFSIPYSVISKVRGGDTRRIRIRNQFNQAPLDPCAMYDYGETEDYLVRIPEVEPTLSISGTVTNCTTQLTAANPANVPIKWQKDGVDIPGATSASYTATAAGAYKAVSQQGDYNWVYQHPKPQGNTITNVFFVDANQGWAVGYTGTILKTNDGGVTWVMQASNVKNYLYDVFFLDANTGYVCGDDVILKTTDGGAHWVTQLYRYNWNGNFGFDLKNVFFINETTGWVSGYSVTLKTIDSGATWTIINNPNGLLFNELHFINTSTGWAASGSNQILKTTDGGLNWIYQTVPPGTNQMTSIYFADANNGWAAGGINIGQILKTTDGGANWTMQPIPGTTRIENLFFIDSSTGWAVGSNGGIYKTNDGGSSWNAQSSGTAMALLSVFFSNSSNGFVAGADGKMLRTINGGNNWAVAGSSSSFSNINAIKMVNSTTGWVAGDNGTILNTVNGGENWTAQTTGVTFNITGISFIDANNGWACMAGSGKPLLKTNNGGATWSSLSIAGSFNFAELTFADANNGYAVSSESQIIKSTDGGATWSTSTAANVKKIKVLGNSIWGYNKYNQTIYRTSNGGTAWTSQQIDASQSILYVKDLCFINANTGWAFCEGGSYDRRIYKTTNGGSSWTLQHASLISYGPEAGFFVDANNGWLFGVNSARTTDGGVTWVPDSRVPIFGSAITGAQFTDVNNGWIIGYQGKIAKYSTNPSSSAYQSNTINNLLISSLNLSGVAVSGTQAATQTIVSTQLVNSGNNTVYQAGKSVTLNPNFQADQGSTFIAQIQAGCN